jgi:hypothetical protein
VAIAVKKIQYGPRISNGRMSAISGCTSVSTSVQLVFHKYCKECEGRCAMARRDAGYLPRENPCAQCGKLIAAPDWIENGPRRISYLWHCQACDYEFEAVAFYDASKSVLDAIAA